MGTTSKGSFETRYNRIKKPGNKMTHPLYCVDCKTLKTRIGEAERDQHLYPIGYRCVKCSLKRLGRQASSNKKMGWRQYLKNFAQNFKK